MGRNARKITLFVLLFGISADAVGKERELSLLDCIKMALVSNKQLQIKRIEVRQAEVKIRGEHSAFWPTLGSQAGFRQEKGVT
ncbi:MAG: TolC family protein, partial [Pseudomonadota bacterium]